ncbi:MAG: hypothetical protein IKW26_07225 [Treponema sp.]|nr:hypothetical protein [Treponema sp.]
MNTKLRKDNNYLGRKTAWSLILTLIFIFFTSCSNVGLVQNGGLVIGVPGSRSVSDTTNFTITLIDAAGNQQSKTVGAGERAQFENLLPGLYSISVEGKEADVSTMYGTTAVSVSAGKTATASVALSTVAHTFDALKTLIAKGGFVYVGSDIKLDEGLQVVDNEVHLIALQDVVLTNNADAAVLTAQDSKVTLGGGKYTLTLDGNDKGQYGVSVTDGSLILEKNAIITNCSNSGVYLSKADFTMNGGIISKNAATLGGGVYLKEGAFIMNDGSITENELSASGTGDGGGVYLENGSFTMNDGSITNNTDGIKRGGAIAVKETALFTMNAGTISGNSASSDGGGIYLFGDSWGNKGRCIINGGTITKNHCESNGGGISVSGDCTVNAGAVITGNTCDNNGGDIYVHANYIYVNNDGTVGDVFTQV